MVNLKEKSEDFKDGYAQYHNELTELVQKTVNYQANNEQSAKMMLDFMLERANALKKLVIINKEYFKSLLRWAFFLPI